MRCVEATSAACACPMRLSFVASVGLEAPHGGLLHASLKRRYIVGEPVRVYAQSPRSDASCVSKEFSLVGAFVII